MIKIKNQWVVSTAKCRRQRKELINWKIEQ